MKHQVQLPVSPVVKDVRRECRTDVACNAVNRMRMQRWRILLKEMEAQRGNA